MKIVVFASLLIAACSLCFAVSEMATRHDLSANFGFGTVVYTKTITHDGSEYVVCWSNAGMGICKK